MNKLLFGIFLMISLIDGAFAKSYLKGWRVYSGGINNATITEEGHKVILKGNGIKSGYILGSMSGTEAWHNKTERLLTIYLLNSGLFTLYVPLVTTKGLRYLTYTTHPDHINKRGKEGRFIYVPLEENEKVTGEEKVIKRNLYADLKRYEPDNKIVEINALMIRGDSEISDISLQILNSFYEEEKEGKVYEDGTGAFRWRVYSGGKENGKITSGYQAFIGSMVLNPVISLRGNGIKSGYILGGVDGADAWHNKTESIVKWTMFNGKGYYIYHRTLFTIYIPIKTTNGLRFMTYTTHPNHRNKRGKYGRLIYLPISSGREAVHFTRNIRQDLQKYEPNNNLLEINGFMVRGTTQIDDIILKKEVKSNLPFDKEKFTQLLKAEEAKLKADPETKNVSLERPTDNIACLRDEYNDEIGIPHVKVYTLDKENKKLKILYSSSPVVFDGSTTTMLENNTRMKLSASINDVEEDIFFNVEQEPVFVTEYSFDHDDS